MTQHTVYIDGASPHAAMHEAALRTLPRDFAIVAGVDAAQVIAGGAAFLRDQLAAGVPAISAVVIDPYAQDWRTIDELWALAAKAGVRVERSNVDVLALDQVRAHFDPIVKGEQPFLVEVHLENLGIESSRLSQVIAQLERLGIDCPTPDLHRTADGWTAGTNDDRVTLRAHCVNSRALTPAVRIAATTGERKVAVRVPLGPDATPMSTVIMTAEGTRRVPAPHVSPARAFWQSIA